MKPETRFKLRVEKDLKTLHPNVWFVKIQLRARRGIPDDLMCVRGRFVALELKKDEHEEPDKLQEYNLSKIEGAGGIGFVAHPKNWKEIFEKIKHMAMGEKC